MCGRKPLLGFQAEGTSSYMALYVRYKARVQSIRYAGVEKYRLGAVMPSHQTAKPCSDVESTYKVVYK